MEAVNLVGITHLSMTTPLDEMFLGTSYDIGYDAIGLLPSMSRNDVGPSYRFAQGDTSQSSSMVRDDTYPPISSTTSPLPTTCMSPPPTIGTALANVHGRDEMRFLLTLGRPTPGPAPPPRVCAYRVQPNRDTPQAPTIGFTH